MEFTENIIFLEFSFSPFLSRNTQNVNNFIDLAKQGRFTKSSKDMLGSRKKYQSL